MKILMVGWYSELGRDLMEDPEVSVTVLEEPSLLSDIPSTVSRVEARYQQDSDYQEVVSRLWETTPFDLVIAGREYGASPAQWLCDKYALPSAGNLATQASTDKSILRRVLEEGGLPTVRSELVHTSADVKRFWNGNPVVLKPANRHASIGVVQISHQEEIDHAWHAATSAGEGSGSIDRNLDWTYIIEDWVPGKEYSVESVFSDGETFHNITEKTVVGGGRFTPVRHVVPAPLSTTESQELIEAQVLLAEVVGIKRGLMHAEWKKDSSQCWPIEFAVRYPGDSISLLIRKATGINLARAWVDGLQGKLHLPAKRSTRSAGIAFIQHPTGRYVKIDGMPSLDSPGVIEVAWTANPGELLLPLDDSKARVGSITVQANDYARVAALLDEYEAGVTISVEHP
ncbi:ATP-grasp domain-containing protein [Streptomyces sp. NPDC048291]|uniref:ATP-grasp domain-containing protein n=1 Tax=Streptomyces sp. NPDC048291 TaxID=3365530 RepID=UPI0037142384